MSTILEKITGRGVNVAALEKKLQAKREDDGRLTQAYHDAVFAANNYTGDDAKERAALLKAKEAAKAARDAVVAEIAEIVIAVAEAKKRETEADRKRAAAERAEARKRTLELCKSRQKAAAKAEKAIAALVESWGELEAAGAAIANTSPVKMVDFGDLHGDLIRSGSLAIVVRLHMAKVGLDWAFPTADQVQPLHEAPTLLERLGRSDEWITRRLDEDAAANPAPAA